ncbi:hypothetical protein [Metakosakonia massiliensis]|uniref:Uncharacterized protein n=1 Tax=Phytobacter massiliensis TaxID=1485952 RepID=A0A6N3B4K6_9ENTR
MVYYSFENKARKYIFVLGLFVVLGGGFSYLLWASHIGMRMVLMKSIPDWLTSITVGCIFGLIPAGRVAWFRPVGKTSGYIFQVFFGGFCLGLVLSLNIYDVWSYLSPGKIVHYDSEYEITFPGPAVARFSHCEAGLWIKDAPTRNWIQLCTNKKALASGRKPGMNAVRVTARTNHLGSYIVDYQFVNTKNK